MFAKLMIICTVVVAALAGARQYPAGVHPTDCPNYPNCASSAFARQHTHDGNSNQQWRYPYAKGFAYAAAPVAPLTPGDKQGAGARYPANFNTDLCPNYPFCWDGGARYPAGLNPDLCPDYPFCRQ